MINVDKEEVCGKALSCKVGLGSQNIYKTKLNKRPRQDSNLQPSNLKSDTLSIALIGHE